MILALASLIAIAYLPGALVYRLPLAGRARRAALSAEERLFWAVIISGTITTLVALALAAAGRYTFLRLLAVDLALAAILIAVARGTLAYNGTAARTVLDHRPARLAHRPRRVPATSRPPST